MARSRPLATDHAPFDFETQKRMGEDDFTKIPNGIPSLEDRVNLYFTHGVKRGQHRSAALCRNREHAGGETVRIVPAQRRDPGRQRRRSGRLRSELSRKNFGENAPDESSITIRSKVSGSKAGRMSSPCAAKSRRAMENLSANSAAANFSSASRHFHEHSLAFARAGCRRRSRSGSEPSI